MLQVIHHNEAGSKHGNSFVTKEVVQQLFTNKIMLFSVNPACLKARELFEKAREGYARLTEALPPNDYYK